MAPRDTGMALQPGVRVQRSTRELPILHLEPQIPSHGAVGLIVEGLVADVCSWSIAEIHAMPREQRVWDLNCVWGWTRHGCRWQGIPASRVIDAAGPLSAASFVLAGAVGGSYSSCFTIETARESLLAWRLDEADLTAEHGWPLRLVPPPTKWAYKGVKWVNRLTLIERFTPGFWEELVGDPNGDIPADVIDHRRTLDSEEENL